MKKLVTLIIFIVFISCDSTIVNNPRNEQHEEELTYTLDIANQTEFSLNNINGNITIIGEYGIDSIIVNVKKIVYANTTEMAIQHMVDIELNFLNTDSHIEVSTDFPDSNELNYQVDFDIIIPDHFLTEVSNINGNIDVSHILANIQLQTVNGNILIQNTTGNAGISTINGNITSSTNEGTLNASTINGNVIIDDFIGSLICDTENGSINVLMDLETQDNCQISAINGNVTLALPLNTSAEVRLEVVIGSINRYDGFNFSETQSSQNFFSGILNDGGSEIAVSIVNGTIQLNDNDQ